MSVRVRSLCSLCTAQHVQTVHKERTRTDINFHQIRSQLYKKNQVITGFNLCETKLYFSLR